MNRACPGDEIYFHKEGQPCSGKVLSTGRHGCIVSHEGKEHRLRWVGMVGHRKRAAREYHVVDAGEDGVVVEDRHGKRHFLTMSGEQRSGRSDV